ncbi:zinc-binding dehydrogenase [Kineosporia succinea]
MLQQDLTYEIGTRELAPREPGEVLVEVAWAGICGSDLHVVNTGAWVSYWPATIGHEVTGRVLESDNPALPVGTGVVLDSRIPRRRDDGALRADRLDADLAWLGEERPGGFAGLVTVPAESAFPVPDSLDLEDAVLAEPLAVTLCALDGVRSAPDRLLVLGFGPIGALTAAAARRRWPSCAVEVVEPGAGRAELARSMGFTVLDAPEGLFDVVVDAAGYPGALQAAVRATRNGGAVLLIALAHGPSSVESAMIVERSLSLTGSHGFDDEHLRQAITFLAEAPHEFRPVVSHRLRLAELPGFLTHGRPDAVKVLIKGQP